MARFDVSDSKWSVIQPLLPTKVCGIARVDDRRVINGILWRWRTGAPWADSHRIRIHDALTYDLIFSAVSSSISDVATISGADDLHFD